MTTDTLASEEVLAAFGDLHALFPDWRIGQLVANVLLAAGRDGELWDVADEDLLTAARRLVERNRDRHAD